MSAVQIALVAQEHPCVPRAKVLAVYPADKIPGRLRIAPGEMLIEAMTPVDVGQTYPIERADPSDMSYVDMGGGVRRMPRRVYYGPRGYGFRLVLSGPAYPVAFLEARAREAAESTRASEEFWRRRAEAAP